MAQLFEQQSDESNIAYYAFSTYLNMGAERTAESVATKCSRSVSLISRWSARHRWVERVAAFEAHLATVEREATEAVVRSKSAEWLSRQEQLREVEWEIHEKAILVGKRVLADWLSRDIAKANLSDLSRLLEMASKLGRLAAGLATDKVDSEVEVSFALKPEFDAALLKIYGQPLPGEIVEAVIVEPATLPAPGGTTEPPERTDSAS